MRWNPLRLGRRRGNKEQDQKKLQKDQVLAAENTEIDLLPEDRTHNAQNDDPIARDYGQYSNHHVPHPSHTPGEDPVWNSSGGRAMYRRNIPIQRVDSDHILSYQHYPPAVVDAPGTRHISMNLEGRYPLALDGTLKHVAIPENAVPPPETYQNTALILPEDDQNEGMSLQPPPEQPLNEEGGIEGNVAGKGSRSAFNPYYANPQAINAIQGSGSNRPASIHGMPSSALDPRGQTSSISNYPVDRTLYRPSPSVRSIPRPHTAPDSGHTRPQSLAAAPTTPGAVGASSNNRPLSYPPPPSSSMSNDYTRGPGSTCSPAVNSEAFPVGQHANNGSMSRQSVPPPLPPRQRTTSMGSYQNHQSQWQQPNTNIAPMDNQIPQGAMAPARTQSARFRMNTSNTEPPTPLENHAQQPIYVQRPNTINRGHHPNQNHPPEGLSTGLHPIGQIFMGKAERAMGSLLSSDALVRSGMEKEQEVRDFKRRNKKGLLQRFQQRNSVHGSMMGGHTYPSQR